MARRSPSVTILHGSRWRSSITPRRRKKLHRAALAALAGQAKSADLARVAHHADAAETLTVQRFAPAAAERAAAFGALPRSRRPVRACPSLRGRPASRPAGASTRPRREGTGACRARNGGDRVAPARGRDLRRGRIEAARGRSLRALTWPLWLGGPPKPRPRASMRSRCWSVAPGPELARAHAAVAPTCTAEPATTSGRSRGALPPWNLRRDWATSHRRPGLW